ncbi:MAG: hypothetical protein FWD13_04135 [Treponema sp.]|nr:hypothetical protein [Treponema sp.]
MRRVLIKFIIVSLLCILAAAMNFLLNTLSVYFLKIPLFLDTLFNAVVCFTAGLFPGIITALLSYTALSIRNGNFDPFIICAIVEVLLIWRLRPAELPPIVRRNELRTKIMPETAVASFVSKIAKLMLLYIICCVTISILGGLIDYFYYTVMSNSKSYFSAEDTFKIGFLRGGIPVLAMNILSRIPVNLVDRFIVIFGGYFISRVICRFVPAFINSEKSDKN